MAEGLFLFKETLASSSAELASSSAKLCTNSSRGGPSFRKVGKLGFSVGNSYVESPRVIRTLLLLQVLTDAIVVQG